VTVTVAVAKTERTTARRQEETALRAVPRVPAVPGEPLHVVQIATPWFEVPPAGYGGIEAVVAGLVDALVDRGHRVTLIGVGRNGTRGEFLATTLHPQGPRVGQANPEVLHAARAGRLLAGLGADVVHDHSTAGPLQAAHRSAPTVVTAHGPVTGEIGDYYRELGAHAHLVAISEAQRRQAPHLPWTGLVHNAVSTSTYPWRAQKEDFALFLGRFSPDKGVHLAIDAAQRAGVRLVLAGMAHPGEVEYFRRQIEPRLSEDVVWIGEVGGAEKLDLLSRARCLLFPVQWEEPFGMVLIEAMACGTPVVALRRGAVPEVVEDGVTGFVRDDVAGLARGVLEVSRIDPSVVRARTVLRFDVAALAAGYEAVYRQVSTAARRPPLTALPLTALPPTAFTPPVAG
jgi:glycosyltransferase involved in cell wall biosynthesis